MLEHLMSWDNLVIVVILTVEYWLGRTDIVDHDTVDVIG